MAGRCISYRYAGMVVYQIPYPLALGRVRAQRYLAYNRYGNMLYARYLCSRAQSAFVYKIPYRRAPRLAYRPLGRVRRASKGILHTKSAYAATRPSVRATIGYLVYKGTWARFKKSYKSSLLRINLQG